jgi:hypothetical protein
MSLVQQIAEKDPPQLAGMLALINPSTLEILAIDDCNQSMLMSHQQQQQQPTETTIEPTLQIERLPVLEEGQPEESSVIDSPLGVNEPLPLTIVQYSPISMVDPSTSMNKEMPLNRKRKRKEAMKASVMTTRTTMGVIDEESLKEVDEELDELRQNKKRRIKKIQEKLKKYNKIIEKKPEKRQFFNLGQYLYSNLEVRKLAQPMISENRRRKASKIYRVYQETLDFDDGITIRELVHYSRDKVDKLREERRSK